MTADDLLASLRAEQHDFANAKQRAAFRRDIERSLSDEQRARLDDADRQRKALDRMMRDPGR